MFCCCAVEPGPTENFGGIEERLRDAGFVKTSPAMDGGPAPMLASLGEDEESDGKIFEAKFTGPHLPGLLQQWNVDHPEETVAVHDRIISVNGKTGTPEEA
eukprot:g22164.t1